MARASNVPVRPPAGCQNGEAVREISAWREVGLHSAGKGGGAAHICGGDVRWIDLHDIKRAGLEREIAGDRHRAGCSRRTGSEAAAGVDDGGADGAAAPQRGAAVHGGQASTTRSSHPRSARRHSPSSARCSCLLESVSVPLPVFTNDPPRPWYRTAHGGGEIVAASGELVGAEKINAGSFDGADRDRACGGRDVEAPTNIGDEARQASGGVLQELHRTLGYALSRWLRCFRSRTLRKSCW